MLAHFKEVAVAVLVAFFLFPFFLLEENKLWEFSERAFFTNFYGYYFWQYALFIRRNEFYNQLI